MNQPRTLVCPECGRTLTTVINCMGVEMWPRHKFATYGDRTMNYADNLDRLPGRADNEVDCYNSSQPVL